MGRLVPPALLGFLLALSVWLGADRLLPAARAAETFRPGSYAAVTGTNGHTLKVRTEPSPESEIRHYLAERRVVRVLAGPYVDDQGWEWYRVSGFDRSGIGGWSAGYFLSPVNNPVLGVPPASPRPPFRVLARVTAYNGAEYGNPWGGHTRLGTMVRRGVVAADPAYIPLGSEMLIEGLGGVFVAEDTGSGVFGYHIDIWLPSVQEAWTFGSRWTYVTVFGRPGYNGDQPDPLWR